MEELLKQLLSGQIQILNRLDNLESQLGNLESQTKENTDFIKALMHQTEEIKAQFDGLLHTAVTKEAIAGLASKDDINKVNTKLEVLNSRLFHQEAALHELRA